MQIPSYQSAVGLTCSNQSRPDMSKHEIGFNEESAYSVYDSAGRYASVKRRAQMRPTASKRYEYPPKRRNAPLPQALVEDDDDEDGDAFDDIESAASLQASPEVTPPYSMPLKFSKHADHVDVSYMPHIDDSRPPSCETSPSDALFEPRTYRAARRLLGSSGTSDSASQRFDRKADETKLRAEQPLQQSASLYSLDGSSRRVFDDTSGLRTDRASVVLSKTQNPIVAVRPRRACSVDSRPSTDTDSASVRVRRSSSYPALNNTGASHQFYWSQEAINSGSCRRRRGVDEVPSEASASSGSMVEHLDSDRNREFSDTVNELDFSNRSVSSRRIRRLRRVAHVPVLTGNQDNLSRIYRGKANLKFRNSSVLKKSMRLRAEVRPQLTASPDSVLTEDYSGHDDVDDMDTEYYDDDLFDMADAEHSTKSSRTQSNKPLTARCSARCSPGSFTRTGFPTASMRQQHALKAENARLRRKLSDLMRQRGDLRAANEILLQQNARLRHSSKRVSAVARMAESATKIIEAHNKSQLVQSAPQTLSAPVYRTSGTVAVVAAQQQQTNTPPLGGVYVSSPTASNSQQAPHAVAALSGPNSLFPSAVVASAVPGTAIALPSHQPLTTVQIQSSSETMVPTSVSTQTPMIHQHNESLTPQPSLTSFYQHPLGHPLGTLSASIASVAHTNLAPVSSAIQVCHYPAPSGGTMYPSVPHAAAATPGMVPVGTPNAVTLVLGQAPPAAYAPIGPQGPPGLHLTSNLKTESASVGSVSQLSYPFPGPSAVLTPVPQCPPTCSLASPDVLGNSASLSLASAPSNNLIETNSGTPPQAPDYSPHSVTNRNVTRREKRSKVH
ncbi:unnamed protein product [Echinostoma caproni]|uniref:BZIP domain-containing protein n=1 Tax=Echinostoma caproni TaxID=27848 RepID=A0A183B595_9TREM|nr:unnamed protein product [Echinostoma caproni]